MSGPVRGAGRTIDKNVRACDELVGLLTGMSGRVTGADRIIDRNVRSTERSW